MLDWFLYGKHHFYCSRQTDQMPILARMQTSQKESIKWARTENGHVISQWQWRTWYHFNRKLTLLIIGSCDKSLRLFGYNRRMVIPWSTITSNRNIQLKLQGSWKVWILDFVSPRPVLLWLLGRVPWNLVQACAEKKTVLLSTSLVWPAVAGCTWAETFSQLSSIYFAQPCTSYQAPPYALVHIHSLPLPHVNSLLDHSASLQE